MLRAGVEGSAVHVLRIGILTSAGLAVHLLKIVILSGARCCCAEESKDLRSTF
jgi:hypothetical protein